MLKNQWLDDEIFQFGPSFRGKLAAGFREGSTLPENWRLFNLPNNRFVHVIPFPTAINIQFHVSKLRHHRAKTKKSTENNWSYLVILFHHPNLCSFIHLGKKRGVVEGCGKNDIRITWGWRGCFQGFTVTTLATFHCTVFKDRFTWVYPPKRKQHDTGNSPCLVGDTSSNGCFPLSC